MPSPRVGDPRRGLGPYQLAILERLIGSGVPAHRARRLAIWGPVNEPARREAAPDNHTAARTLFAALTEED